MKGKEGLRLVIYGLVLVHFWLFFETWYGDATIYLAGRWLQFNPGELSGVYTSPLWAIIASVFHSPTSFKIVALLMTLWAVKSIMDAVGDGGLAEVMGFIAILPFLIHGLIGFETGLAIALTVNTWQGKTWAAYLLPLARPEGVLISLFYGKGWHKLLSITPFVVWFTLTLLTDNGSSILTRAGEYFDWRYMALPVTVLVLEASRVYGLTGLIVLSVILGFSAHNHYYTTMNERGKGYSFEKITGRAIVEELNKIASPGDVVQAREIQLRRYLREDVKITSPEGLVKTGGDWTWRISSNRDKADSTLIQIGGIEVNTPGFVQWFLIERKKPIVR